MSSAVPSLKSGKWSVEKAVEVAEQKLQFKEILGYHQSNRAGLGSIVSPKPPPKGTHEHRKFIADVVNEEEEEVFSAKAVQLHLQGYWTTWCHFIKNDLSWKTLLSQPHNITSFCIRATYDTLPSPSNLHRWSANDSANCFLCNKLVCTSAHILSACKTALDQGRYTYRHDSILSIIAESIKSFLLSYSPVPSCSQIKKINFVKEGVTVPLPKKKTIEGLLYQADDWVMLVDLESRLVVPSFLASTALRPDILIFSKSTRCVVLIKLTSPCEENFEDRHKMKIANYMSLCEEIRSNKWNVDFFAVEVGARGYCAESMRCCLYKLGFSNKLCRTTLKSLSSCALKCSFYIWLSRNNKTWECHESFEKKNFVLKRFDPSSSQP